MVSFSNVHTLDRDGLEKDNYHRPCVGNFAVHNVELVDTRVVRVPAVIGDIKGGGRAVTEGKMILWVSCQCADISKNSTGRRL